MEMDDPWGSPWADEIQTPHPVTLQEDDFAVKPTTPVKAASLALAQKTNSPWDDADDDGFGDWNSGSAEEEKGLGLDGVNDGWKSNTGNGFESGLKVEGSHALSASWDSGAIAPGDSTPKLGPSLFPKPTDILRQRSPDPWAVDANREDNSAEAAAVPADEHDASVIATEPVLDLSIENEITTDVAPAAVEDGGLPETTGTGNGSSTDSEADIIVEGSSKSNAEGIESSNPVDITDQNGDTPETEHVSSRPSSSPSEHSHHEETTQESPRTSLDEEPKRPHVTRKVSNKIQGLVEHFDGLAKQEDVSAPILGRSGRSDLKMENVGNVESEERREEMDDFGDFEDVQSETEEPIDDGKANYPTYSPAAEDLNEHTHEAVAIHEQPQAHVGPKDLGPVEFIVDTASLNNLYSGAEPENPPEKLFIPDVIPHDSFSSTQERKTWYRISRYGAMRKHNTGDDDNYIRVNWTQSQTRVETLETVARWIEEDRISGRVVLGGASKGSSIFGWNDSKAAPVPLAAAFAVKNRKQKVTPSETEPSMEIPREWPKGLVRTRSTSSTSSPSKSRRKSSTKPTASEENKPEAQLPVANFGWNSTPQGVQDSESQPPAHEKKLPASSSSTLPQAAMITPISRPGSSRTSSSLTEPRQRVIPINGIAPRPHSIAHTSISIPPSLSTSSFTNEDDDWGELVSSPSTNHPPVLPPPKKSLHKTTGSLGSVFLPAAPIPQMTSVHSRLVQPEQSGGWASRLTEDLATEAPENMNPMTTNAKNIFSQNDFTIPNKNEIGKAFSPAAQIAPQPVSAANVDPWASADFSFFENGALPVSKQAAAPIPKLIPPRHGTFGAPAVASIPPRNQNSREELEQDRIVQSIVKGLPDLSYMLRK